MDITLRDLSVEEINELVWALINRADEWRRQSAEAVARFDKEYAETWLQHCIDVQRKLDAARREARNG